MQLGVGHFFGEIAVLRRSRRSATVTATTRTSLLVLDAHDLHVLMDREPLIAERIDAEVRRRLGGELVKPDGDILPEELEGEEEMPVRPSHRPASFLMVDGTRSGFSQKPK